MKNTFFIAVFIVASVAVCRAQADEGLFNRLQGFANGEFKFFNTDGIEIAAIPMKGEFTPRSIAKKYREFNVKATDLKDSDSLLPKPNYYITKKLPRGVVDYYFLWHQDQLLGLSFTSHFDIDRQFERAFIELLTSGKIPQEVYQPMQPTNVNFAGREIDTQGCTWMNPNNLQCPYNGQMNWSSFRTMEAAQRELDAHFNFINLNGRGKIISDEQVDVIFEGQDVKARKVVFDLTGVTSALASMTGGKTLTAYLVAAPVRDKVVECVMSHWNNDRIGDGGLPVLLAEVMQLK